MTIKPRPNLDPSKGYLTKLTLENIRCFGSPAEELSLTKPGTENQPARWTVILGPNGVGKTTVLRALAEARAYRDAADRIPSTKLAAGYFARNNGGQGRTGWWLSNNQSAWGNYHNRHPVLHANYSDNMLKNWDPLPIGGYGASRAWRGSREKSFDPTTTLYDPSSQVRDPSQTLADWTSFELSNPNFDFGVAQNLRKALRELLPKVEAVELDFDREKRPFAKFKTFDGWVPLDDMSWGQQVFAAFAADYASRLIDWYSGTPNPLHEPGICLVDELDLHMHPSWQRKVIDHLSDVFPATQFIVTVHSPLVVQAAEDANLAVLKRYPEDPSRVQILNDVEAIKGWRIDQVLTSDLFGLESARSLSVEQDLKEREHLLAQDELSPSDKKRLQVLDAHAMVLPTPESNWDKEAQALIKEAAEAMKRLA